MIVLGKIIAGTAFLMAAFIAPALLIVGSCILVTHWLGDAWWVGFLLAPAILGEFVGSISFFLWAGPHIDDWMMRGDA